MNYIPEYTTNSLILKFLQHFANIKKNIRAYDTIFFHQNNKLKVAHVPGKQTKKKISGEGKAKGKK